MNWVRNVSRDDVGRAGEGGVDVAALHARDREDVAALVQLRRTLGERRERVRDRLEHLVLDVDSAAAARAAGAVSAATAAITSPT